MSEKKSLLIAMDTMMCGGIEKAAVSMLSALPVDRYDVTLMLLTKRGEFLDLVPSWVKIVEVPLSADARDEWVRGRRKVLLGVLKRGQLLHVVRLLAHQFYCAFFVQKDRRPAVRFRSLLRGIHLDDVEYDCAMAYHNIEQAVMVAEKIRAKRKVTWFHTELSKQPTSPRIFRKIYGAFDVFATASQTVAGEVKRFFPEFANRVGVFPLITDGKFYSAMAKQADGFDDLFNGLRILSVGRLSPQKGFDLAISVHARLVREGYRIRWYVVGQGSERENLEQLIARNGVKESFVLLGLKKNPYTFFAQCDLYVQPSRYEGYCITVAEARSFCKPIVCTDFAGAREQIRHGETGFIVPCDEETIYSAVKCLLDDPVLRRTFVDNLSQSTVDTTHELNKVCNLFDG